MENANVGSFPCEHRASWWRGHRPQHRHWSLVNIPLYQGQRSGTCLRHRYRSAWSEKHADTNLIPRMYLFILISWFSFRCVKIQLNYSHTKRGFIVLKGGIINCCFCGVSVKIKNWFTSRQNQILKLKTDP